MSCVLHGESIHVHAGGFAIVRDACIRLQTGELLALVGPNGAGKTTLLRAMVGVVPMQGEVNVHGKALASNGRERAQTMAYVPQHSRLFAAVSAREVVEWGRFPHRGSALGWSSEDRLVVDQAMATCDCGYLQDRAFVDCSGGEQARLLLARALATQAQVLLLDEPAASLDIAHRLRLYQLLRRLVERGYSIIVVLHQLEDAWQYADSVAVMDQGQIVAQGPTAQTLTAALVRKVWGVDMQPHGGVSYHLPEGDAGHVT
ncbi:MAG: ABC transporter ATP-binding protein [Planctomycetota bacterium]|nr:MAG: ABC transporter ATP-binding protein [Planctomycetota bacterium]